MVTDFVDDYFEKTSIISKKLNKELVEDIVDGLYFTRENKGRVFILGVGGSAGNASHAVNDFRKLCGIEAYAPTDNVSELTARTNDEGWETIFSEWLKISNLSDKDSLFIFSVGGGSVEKNVSMNLVHAIDLAKSKNSKVFAIVGKNNGYAANKADTCLLVPLVDEKLVTPLTEAFHAVIWHCLVSHPKLQICDTKW